MDRRKFLQTITALAAAAVVPDIAAATAPVDPNAKYREAIRLFDRCVPYASDEQEISARVNDLLGYLKENFVAPEVNDENIEATRLLLCSDQYSIADIRSVPPVVADAVYPIALLRMGLRAYNMKINPNQVENFIWYHRSYGVLIFRSIRDS